MNRTKIEWVRNPDGTSGFTWNPVTGCLGPGGELEQPRRCSWCYAWRLAQGRLSSLYQTCWPTAIPLTKSGAWDPFWPRFWISRLNEPFFRKKPAGIFISSMGDLFGDWIPTEWIERILWTMQESSQHRFYFLTKNPRRYKEFEPWPDNCWLGTTVTNQQDWDERWPEMEKVQAKVRFVSFEPLIGLIQNLATIDEVMPDWMMIGAMTGTPRIAPPPKSVRQLSTFATEWANIPIFHKDNLDCEGLGIMRRREMPC